MHGVADRREGIAQLMREHREKFVLAPISLVNFCIEHAVFERYGGSRGQILRKRELGCAEIAQ